MCIRDREKERIARKVASQIPDGATLFIDIGTTPEAVAHALLEHNDLRIVTCLLYTSRCV